MRIIIYNADDATNHRIDIEDLTDARDCKLIAKISDCIEEYYEKREWDNKEN